MRWIAKAVVQAALARMPWGIGINHLLQRRDWRDWARKKSVGLARTIALADSYVEHRGIAVEIGTGWVPVVPVLLHLKGYEVHSYDKSRHVTDEMLQATVSGVEDRLEDVSAILAVADAKKRLDNFTWTYHAPGDAASTGLEKASLIYSYNVLEHIPEHSLINIIKEAKRLGGVFYAKVGLHDHFFNFDRSITRVNFLKFDDWVWGFLGQHRIHYHNRLRINDFDRLLSDFHPLYRDVAVDPRDVAAVKSMRLAKRFRGYSVEDLAAHWLEFVGT